MAGGGDERAQAATAAAGSERAADPFARGDAPLLALTLWPHRSLSRNGFAWFIAATAAGLTVPLLPLMGSNAAWGLLPFLLAMLIGIYAAIQRSYADGRLVEELRLWPDLITVERREPRGPVRRWHANPFWVQVRLLDDARIEKYLTLKGNGREIELGAFLSPGERERLYGELGAALTAIRAQPEPA
jgi:uncharacterized membrane protein